LQHRDVLDAVYLRLLVYRLELADVGVLGDDEQLAELAVRNAVRLAIGIEHAARAGAVLRPLAAGRIIQAGVDHLAVARRGAGADRASRLGDDHVVALHRRLPRDGEPAHARADHHHLHDQSSSSASIRSPGAIVPAAITSA